MGYGQQFCPACLAEDVNPYFRKRWRVAFYTFCTKHNIMMLDRCPECGSGVTFHRIEQGRYGGAYECSIAMCHECGFDLCRAPLIGPRIYEGTSNTLFDALRVLEDTDNKRFDSGFFKVLHQLCKIVLANSKHTKLREYVIRRSGAEDIPLQIGKICFEERSLQERHHIIQLGMWLISDPSNRIMDAWQEKAVRYNVLKRDFQRMPEWYRHIVGQCSNWRNITEVRKT